MEKGKTTHGAKVSRSRAALVVLGVVVITGQLMFMANLARAQVDRGRAWQGKTVGKLVATDPCLDYKIIAVRAGCTPPVRVRGPMASGRLELAETLAPQVH